MHKITVICLTIVCLLGFCLASHAADQPTPAQELAQAQLVELVANDRVAYLQGLLAQAQEIAVRAKTQREEAAKKVAPAPKQGTTAPKKGAE